MKMEVLKWPNHNFIYIANRLTCFWFLFLFCKTPKQRFQVTWHFEQIFLVQKIRMFCPFSNETSQRLLSGNVLLLRQRGHFFGGRERGARTSRRTRGWCHFLKGGRRTAVGRFESAVRRWTRNRLTHVAPRSTSSHTRGRRLTGGSNGVGWLEGGQCDQIGRFLKVLGNNFSLKSCPKIQWLFKAIWKSSLFSKNWSGFILWNIWLLLIPTSGHTDWSVTSRRGLSLSLPLCVVCPYKGIYFRQKWNEGRKQLVKPYKKIRLWLDFYFLGSSKQLPKFNSFLRTSDRFANWATTTVTKFNYSCT